MAADGFPKWWKPMGSEISRVVPIVVFSHGRMWKVFLVINLLLRPLPGCNSKVESRIQLTFWEYCREELPYKGNIWWKHNERKASITNHMTYQLDHDLESMKKHRYNAPGKKALPGLFDGCGFLFVLNDEQTLCSFRWICFADIYIYI